ncbi:glycine cleavage system aminomethyltransferase GcvT [Glaciimonas sp. CA11.2]|uniref:glycine cleavage system aminomethyltransferase GcvT n=1 Tax=unclassified Glaciimonas TaxID=2644401 RepID=UPI002AB388BA|nr:MULTISPECIES: glycine cleavage system aminomethyltransferase GcvT [unclassified Glaciimonas]MDY7548569.1 glycine cleavage system aminomethyltransferase GcvT [Glaciimonas sp. CA11.2]MEB0013756.1 glycine cleavage system aminomethyltransferase GcvT [Glaciimonas sp. Cout2]MEB0083361.1 glycine cleavage system aminomethyltransferase GcvT [Glaciimonas sp. Gout2]MEB0164806.1 glycine cleavage system aminomethyltransferase GcvT [Glaciimonas sp. CA11.2]
MESNSQSLARTPLYDLHLELGAKMVPFAGYQMPVQYPTGVLKEHTHTRTQAGLFDVSHMGQVRLSGAHAAAALETLVPVDIIDLAVNTQRYAVFTNASGGILDDLMVANSGDHLLLVVNAACKQQDLAHLQKHLSEHCSVEELNDRALLALQGPLAAKVLARLAPNTAQMIFMQTATVMLAGVNCFVSRSGYTGEDGFEISVPNHHAEALARVLLSQPEVAPIGLGARDSLRLEAGLCLYGHDMDANITPVEASLAWALSKVRRADQPRAGGYPGAEIILRQLAEGVARKRVGLLPQDRMPVREGAEVINANGEIVGKVTSGGFGPTLGGPVAMGYVESAHATVGTTLHAIVRGKPIPVVVAKTPFVPQRYYRG